MRIFLDDRCENGERRVLALIKRVERNLKLRLDEYGGLRATVPTKCVLATIGSPSHDTKAPHLRICRSPRRHNPARYPCPRRDRGPGGPPARCAWPTPSRRAWPSSTRVPPVRYRLPRSLNDDDPERLMSMSYLNSCMSYRQVWLDCLKPLFVRSTIFSSRKQQVIIKVRRSVYAACRPRSAERGIRTK